MKQSKFAKYELVSTLSLLAIVTMMACASLYGIISIIQTDRMSSSVEQIVSYSASKAGSQL